MLLDVYGILGGTFDPPHVAHLAAAHSAFEQLELDTVRLLPARMPWQKAMEVVTGANQRWAMCRLAAAEAAYMVADDTEMRRSGPTYTIDTIDTIGSEVVLILGADTAAGIPTWHRWEEVVERAHIAVVPRRGTTEAEIRSAIGSSYTMLEMPVIDLSATQIRDHVRAGRRPRFLVPDSVLEYIVRNSLYRNRDS
jgi:nicotinate-nucleotide adenylyltransferase